MAHTLFYFAVAFLLVSEVLCRPKGDRRYHEITESLEFDPPSPHSHSIGLKGIRYTMKCCFRKHRHHRHRNVTENIQFENWSQDGAENEQSSNIDIEQTSANGNQESFHGAETTSDQYKNLRTSDLDETKTGSTFQRHISNSPTSDDESSLAPNQEQHIRPEQHQDQESTAPRSVADSHPKHVSGLPSQDELNPSDRARSDQSEFSFNQQEETSSKEQQESPTTEISHPNVSDLSSKDELSTSDAKRNEQSSFSIDEKQRMSSSSEDNDKISSEPDNVSETLQSINSRLSASSDFEHESETTFTTETDE